MEHAYYNDTLYKHANFHLFSAKPAAQKFYSANDASFFCWCGHLLCKFHGLPDVQSTGTQILAMSVMRLGICKLAPCADPRTETERDCFSQLHLSNDEGEIRVDEYGGFREQHISIITKANTYSGNCALKSNDGQQKVCRCVNMRTCSYHYDGIDRHHILLKWRFIISNCHLYRAA